ncbi:hypothetical protein KZO25_15650 [Halomonas sp. ANAO-440]|uniref:hypothetical protein n=1 Tax=Halomonas sp. ANAO-440 TaxID=2861360 RepID=UPI001CAA4DF5|nr:hypothetical protein [Halomonas sp. ANAO-440]MBZ0331751.1 hypothetical protein [Halomonas sp. ANAO-440]
MGMDQAAGLRKWSNMTPRAPQEACPDHVAAMLVSLGGGAAPAGHVGSAPTSSAQASAQRPRRRLESDTTLMVLGLPGTGAHHTGKVTELFEAWANEGRDWVGNPRAWRVVALPAGSPHLPVLAGEQARWALWVDADPEAFRRAYRVLKQVAERGGPQRMLLVHPPSVGRQGLLSNLRHAAASYLGIELLVLAR